MLRGLLQLIVVVGGTLAIALWLLNRLFPPIQRAHDARATLFGGGTRRGKVSPATPVIQVSPPISLPATPAWLRAYWGANLRLIVPYLLIWLLSVILPSLLAEPLNQLSVLTGFPLGYYMGAQGSLLIFVALTFLYAWRMQRLDRQYGLDTPSSPAEKSRRYQLMRRYAGFTLGFSLFVLVISLLDITAHISVTAISWIFILITIGLYTVIGLRSRTHHLDEYYVAGRRVPGALNGLATGSDWMSAASFISMAGAIYILGHEGLAYIMGWTGGYVLLVLLLAPYLRKFGQFTIPDFIGTRYPGAATRVIAAIISIIISFTYVTAQVTGIGIIMSRFLGVNYMIGVVVGLSAVLLCSFLGGMQAITWTQGVQGIILVIAYLVPVTWLSVKITGIPLPQLMYGQAMHQIEALETIQGIQSYSQPFNDWTPWNFLALTFCLMLGTAGMPHILVRFYTVPNVSEARSSVSWALAWIMVLYLTAPAYAAFSRLEILQEVVNKSIAELPQWAENWAATGLLTFADTPEQGGNGDGYIQYHELQIDQDLVVLATPEIAGLPATVVALVAAGGMAAALSTADGLLMVIASAVAHDIFHRTLNPKSTPSERLRISRLMVLTAAILAALTAIQRLAIIVQMVAWAFSLAAASFFPVLVLGIFWKGATSRGAATGMISGLIVTAGYMVMNYTFPDWGVLGISHSAAGIFGVPVNFLVTWFISRVDPDPPDAVTYALVDGLRHPGGVGVSEA